MDEIIDYHDLGTMDFKDAWDYQVKLFQERVDQKLLNRKFPEESTVFLKDQLLFVEHPNVYTLGKSGNHNNLLIQDDFLEKINAKYYHIDRGGDITYHGPGQIVGYPIFDLDHYGIHLKQYVYGLEECIIRTLKEFDINAARMEGATGVWLDAESNNARKICAIGVKASRYITMHGFAFNINTNLDYFSYINPCGFTDKGVTSLQNELNSVQDIVMIKTLLKDKIISYFSELKE